MDRRGLLYKEATSTAANSTTAAFTRATWNRLNTGTSSSGCWNKEGHIKQQHEYVFEADQKRGVEGELRS